MMSDPDSVDDALGKDHERLDGLLHQLKAGIQSNAPAARKTLAELMGQLVHHMTWEDEVLFPAVKELAGAKERRSIESLEIDHERIRDTLRSLESSLAAGDFELARSLVRWLDTLLRGHNYDEEHGVYVDADRLLTPAVRRALIERFAAR
jgi:hemerythrin-like domain-containing protein